MDKPPSGYFSSEFAMAVISKIIAALAIFGVFTPEQASELTKDVIAVSGLFLAIFTTIGYTAARLALKKKTLEAGIARTEAETRVSIARINGKFPPPIETIPIELGADGLPKVR